jgi:uncharacterized membrane protein YhhN
MNALRGSRAPALLAFALLAALSYPLTFDGGWLPRQAIVWKGMGAGLLALWLLLNAQHRDQRWLAAVIALWAAGDMVLERDLVGGALFFAAGHGAAWHLFRRHRAEPADISQLGMAIFTGAVIGAAGIVLAAGAWKGPAGIYGIILGAMLAAARQSRFALAGWGALLFTLSDLLIFARTAMAAPPAAVGYGIWYLYATGVALIAIGVWPNLDDRAPRG